MVVEDEPKLRVQPSNTLGEYHKIPPAPNVSSVITDAWLMLLVADAALPSSVYIHTRLSIYEELNLYFGRKLNRKYWCIFRCVLPAWSFFFRQQLQFSHQHHGNLPACERAEPRWNLRMKPRRVFMSFILQKIFC